MESIKTARPLMPGYAKKLHTGRMRRTLLRLILIFVGIGVGLSLSEVAMRAFQIGHKNTVIRYNDKVLKLKPHLKFMNYRENKNLVETNNLGFHDHEREAANGNYRILFLGDSFLEGRQVQTESLFTIRLEKKFLPDGQKIENINGGVPGTGTAHQYVLWKEFFEPNIKVDHLVLCFNMDNDLRDNNLDLSGGEGAFFVDSQGKILESGSKPGLLREIVNPIRDHSYLINTLYESAYKVKESLRAEAEENVPGQQANGNTPQQWEVSEQGTIALIRKWKSELAGKNIPFDVVIIERPERVYNKFESDFIDKLRATCAQDQIDCLRLKLSSNPFETYSFDGISLGHFNDKGHEMAANELYDYFKTYHRAIFNRSPR